MFGPSYFWDKSVSLFLKILKFNHFKFFKNLLGEFIPNGPPEHAITSTNSSNQVNFTYNSSKKKEKESSFMKG